MTFAELRIDVVILVCAISAGIHAALAPAHFDEGAGAGIGFVVATIALAACAVALTKKPSERALYATGAVLFGLIVSYVLAITTGVPVLHPEVEEVEALAVCTKVIEAVGLLLVSRRMRRTAPVPLPLTALVAVFSALVALAASGGMHMDHGHTHGFSVHVTHPTGSR
jgi:hypothetical protein